MRASSKKQEIKPSEDKRLLLLTKTLEDLSEIKKGSSPHFSSFLLTVK
jgi:hypothetical protein